MARIWDDTCGDLYDTSKVLLAWDYFAPGNGAYDVVSSIDGATGNCLRMTTGLGGPVMLRKNLPVTSMRLIAGMRYQINGLPNFGYVPIMSFWDGAPLANTTLYVDAAGRLSVWHGFLGTLAAGGTQVGAASVPAIVHVGTFIHLGFDLTWGTSGGALTVYANSQVVLTASGIQTAENDNGIGMFSIWTTGGVSSPGTVYVDDIYINDTIGGHNNGFDGDIQGLAFLPNGLGRVAQQAIGGAPPPGMNWQSINQATPDDDVTYVTAATTGLSDMYAVGPLSSSVSSIVCVSTVLDAKTDMSGLGPGGAKIRPKIGDGMTEANGAEVSLNTTYANKYQSWGINPLTTRAWDPLDWPGIEVGHERTA